MLIEFFGLPGSGKSTISRTAADLFQAQGLIVEEVTFELDHRPKGYGRILTKLTHIVRFAAKHPFHAMSDVVGVMASGQATWKDGSKALFNWLFIASLASRRRVVDRITMLDQGVAQALWSVRFAAMRHAGPEAMLSRLQAAAFMPDIVFHVRTSLQVVGDRLSARADNVSRLDSQGENLQALQRSESQAAALLEQLRKSGVCVVDIFNEEPSDLVPGAHCIVDAVLARIARENQKSRVQSEQPIGPPENGPLSLERATNTAMRGGALE